MHYNSDAAVRMIQPPKIWKLISFRNGFPQQNYIRLSQRDCISPFKKKQAHEKLLSMKKNKKTRGLFLGTTFDYDTMYFKKSYLVVSSLIIKTKILKKCFN